MTSTRDSKLQIELFVKSSTVEKSEKGSCPISQKWFMVFFTMVKQDIADFKLTTVNLDNLPQCYLELNVARRFPVVRIISGSDPLTGEDITGRIYDNDDDIEAFMERLKCPNMQPASSAFKVTENLYRNFNTYLVRNSPDLLIKDLTSLNNFIGNREVPYLSGYELSYIDCHIMPKLQHIRVVCEGYKEIMMPPKDLLHLWKYYDTMYKNEQFIVSVPSDRDILMHYYDKVSPKPQHMTPPTLIGDFKTLSIPAEIGAKLHNGSNTTVGVQEKHSDGEH